MAAVTVRVDYLYVALTITVALIVLLSSITPVVEEILSTRLYYTLTNEVISGIKKFVLFVGYERSGHSIVGSLMDAHPHVVISHEFFLFDKFDSLNKVPNDTWRDNLFQSLFNESVNSAIRPRSEKGYTLKVEGLWEGDYLDHIEVIGDKSGGMTTKQYRTSRKKFNENFLKLKRSIGIPIRAIHVIRNPFDMISTNYVFTKNSSLLKHLKENPGEKITVDNSRLKWNINSAFHKFEAVTEIINNILKRENVIDIHNCDLVSDPRGTLRKIFNFLEVHTTEYYLDMCAEKVFKSVSQSRDMIEWPSELREMVETRILKYATLRRYHFTSN